MSKTTLVLGASENPERYSNKALKSLKERGFSAIAIGRKRGESDGISIQTGQPILGKIDTITMYLNPKNQIEYYDYILGINPRRIIFNPGSENPELIAKAVAKGIECEIACTLVMLSTNQF